MSTVLLTNWLHDYKKAWLEKNLSALRDLFTEDVEYWETPFVKLDDADAVVNEWQAITSQEDIVFDSEIMLAESTSSVVRWKLHYGRDGAEHDWAGLYLITLDDVGKCSYFYQVGEQKV